MTDVDEIDEKLNAQFRDLEHRLVNHSPKGETGRILDSITNHCLSMGYFLCATLPDSREKSLALTKLEELSMWAKASVARNQ